MHKVMDVTHNDTRSSFKQRAQPLADKDIWYPLTLDQSLAKEKKHIHQLWDALNISFDDYFRIITDNEGFWAKKGREGWDSVFMKWGYPVGTVTVMRQSKWDGKKIMWANFFKGTKKASMKETLNGPTGIHPARNGKLPTPMDPCGFHYHNSRKLRALGPAEATAAPTGTELQQEGTLKTPIANKKLDALLPVEVTPEINHEAMLGSHGSDFYNKGGELCTSSSK